MKFLALSIVALLAGCGLTQTQLETDAAIATTVTCAASSAAVLGVAVDTSIDTSKAAAAVGQKINNGATTLCSGVSAAAKATVASAATIPGSK